MTNHEKAMLRHRLDMASIDLTMAINQLEQALQYNDDLEDLILQLCNINDDLKNFAKK